MHKAQDPVPSTRKKERREGRRRREGKERRQEEKEKETINTIVHLSSALPFAHSFITVISPDSSWLRNIYRGAFSLEIIC
jgi:hypothetical protein